jgi:hypothetical protein
MKATLERCQLVIRDFDTKHLLIRSYATDHKSTCGVEEAAHHPTDACRRFEIGLELNPRAIP